MVHQILDIWKMDRTQNYSAILTQVLRQVATPQPRLQPLRISSVCDAEAGQLLIIATGWDKERWLNTILFHARLVEGKVIIEDDNFEEGVASALIASGIAIDDITTSLTENSVIRTENLKANLKELIRSKNLS